MIQSLLETFATVVRMMRPAEMGLQSSSKRRKDQQKLCRVSDVARAVRRVAATASWPPLPRGRRLWILLSTMSAGRMAEPPAIVFPFRARGALQAHPPGGGASRFASQNFAVGGEILREKPILQCRFATFPDEEYASFENCACRGRLEADPSDRVPRL